MCAFILIFECFILFAKCFVSMCQRNNFLLCFRTNNPSITEQFNTRINNFNNPNKFYCHVGNKSKPSSANTKSGMRLKRTKKVRYKNVSFWQQTVYFSELKSRCANEKVSSALESNSKINKHKNLARRTTCKSIHITVIFTERNSSAQATHTCAHAGGRLVPSRNTNKREPRDLFP
jgi:hypothetical protein